MSEQLANQIAAGEVVERPASVIKECIENSFDAQACRIEVRVEKAGSQFIQIKDNGKGIAADDLELAIARHATSKIARIEDLESLLTMGFRGEALASIASVARVHICTRTADSPHGYCLKSLGGAVLEKLPQAMAVGTRVDITDLFYNTPARRRFMRSERTEWGHIDDVFKRLAMTHPCVEMDLYHQDKRTSHYVAGTDCMQQEERLHGMMGAEWLAQTVPVCVQDTGIALRGWVSQPAHVRMQADKQFLIVNGRAIRDHAFAHAVKRAMGDLLYQNKHPSWLLYLDIDPMRIDVNIHPTKDRLRFAEASWVYDWVYKNIRKAFRPDVPTVHSAVSSAHFVAAMAPRTGLRAPRIPALAGTLWDDAMPAVAAPVDTGHVPHSRDVASTVADARPSACAALAETGHVPHSRDVASAAHAQPSACAAPDVALQMSSAPLATEVSAAPAVAQGAPMRALCQIAGAYILGVHGQDIWLIDMHAAHERQLMEKLMQQYRKAGLHRDHLLLPILVEDTQWNTLLEEHQGLLAQYGFDMAQKDAQWRVLTHPRGLHAQHAWDVFMQLITHIQHDLLTVDAETLLQEVLATVACHAAIRVSRVMTDSEMQYFMESLGDIPEVCNHGRPWKWVLSRREMDALFLRGR